MIIYCSKCGKRVPDKARHCLYCGEEVVINRNDPEAVEMKLEDFKEERLKEFEAQQQAQKEAEAVREKQRVEYETLISKYEEEIKTFQRRRNAFIIPSLILAVIGIAGAIIFYTLFIKFIAENEIPITYISLIQIFTDESIPNECRLYYALSLVFSLLFEGGIALLAIGVIPNIIKVANRRKKINEMRNKLLL